MHFARREKDVRSLAESYGGRRTTVADGRFIFGIRRIRNLISLVHWVQDFLRFGEVPTLTEFGEDGAAFRAALKSAFYRDDVRKNEKEQSDTVSMA